MQRTGHHLVDYCNRANTYLEWHSGDLHNQLNWATDSIHRWFIWSTEDLFFAYIKAMEDGGWRVPLLEFRFTPLYISLTTGFRRLKKRRSRAQRFRKRPVSGDIVFTAKRPQCSLRIYQIGDGASTRSWPLFHPFQGHQRKPTTIGLLQPTLSLKTTRRNACDHFSIRSPLKSCGSSGNGDTRRKTAQPMSSTIINTQLPVAGAAAIYPSSKKAPILSRILLIIRQPFRSVRSTKLRDWSEKDANGMTKRTLERARRGKRSLRTEDKMNNCPNYRFQRALARSIAARKSDIGFLAK